MSKQVIYKYTLTNRINEIELPVGSIVLSFQSQFNDPTIWVLLNPSEVKKMKRVFVVINTGEGFNANEFDYIGTYQSDSGNYVGHLLESRYPYKPS